MGPSTILVRLVLEASTRAILTLPVKARGPFHRRWATLCNVVMLERTSESEWRCQGYLGSSRVTVANGYIVDIAW